MSNNLNSASASFVKLWSNSFFEILPKSTDTENKFPRYTAMKKPPRISFLLSLSIAILLEKCMKCYCMMMLWQKPHNISPLFFYYFFLNKKKKKSVIFPVCVILNSQIVILLEWVFCLCKKFMFWLTLQRVIRSCSLPAVSIHTTTLPFKNFSDHGSEWKGLVKSLHGLCLQSRGWCVSSLSQDVQLHTDRTG